IGSGRDHGDDLRAGVLAVFSAVGVGEDVKFADGIDAEQLTAGTERGIRTGDGAGAEQIHAVDHEMVLAGAAAVDGEGISGGVLRAGNAGAVGLNNAGIQGQELVKTAAVEGQVFDLLLGDLTGSRAGRGVHDGGFCCDSNQLLYVADLQVDV